MSVRILIGDSRDKLRELPDASVHCCVTSPPYFGLRDYGHEGQMGLEPTPAEFVEGMVGLFREVRRVLRDDGTLWLNIGDSYGADKNRLMVPALLALALRDDGWVLRDEIVWHKPDPMPCGVTDRTTPAHEMLYLLSKRAKYYLDPTGLSETGVVPAGTKRSLSGDRARAMGREPSGNEAKGFSVCTGTRNKRSVWTVKTAWLSDAHFATYPPALIEPCILAGCPKGGTVLDPFGGAGTTGLVADRLGRNALLIELNPAYAAIAERRIANDARLFGDIQAA